MNEWKKVKLGEIALNIQTGPFGSQLHQSDYEDTGIPVIMPKDIIDGKISEDTIARVPFELSNKLLKYKVEFEDIIYPRRGDISKCAIIDKWQIGWLCGTGCLKISIDKSQAKSKFIYYELQLSEQTGWIINHAIGATMLNLNTNILQNVPIVLPQINVQERIIEILSRYDSLIENYQKQIKLLEESAQRLYKEWFIDLRFPGHENTKIVDGVPEGWEKKSIAELGSFINGFAFKPSDWQDKGLPIIKIKEMGNGISVNTPRNNGERVPKKYLVTTGDLLFSWSATLMVIVWTGENGWLNQHLFKVIPKEGISREFVLQSISYTITEFSNITTGSTMKHIQRNKLNQVFVNVPCIEIMQKYNIFGETIREQIINISSQIHKLTEARDRLLPKLMSGEIEV